MQCELRPNPQPVSPARHPPLQQHQSSPEFAHWCPQNRLDLPLNLRQPAIYLAPGDFCRGIKGVTLRHDGNVTEQIPNANKLVNSR
jgi:hypothetical protein